MSAGTKLTGDLVLTRELDAPRALVFRAWVEPERFARWFGPHGTTIEPCALDPRPGGAGFPREMRITATFAERDGRTTITIRHAGLDVDQGEGGGWRQALERLADLTAR